MPERPRRRVAALAHRWLGLLIAAFLFVAGLTGSVISWDHELDAWLNPHLFIAQSRSAEPVATPLEFAARIEAGDPRVRVTYLPLHFEAGRTLVLGLNARVDPATGALFEPDYNQVALDPHSGEIQGKRFWGAVSLARENLLPFLYKLHYSLHIPEAGGIEFGIWLMGLVAIVWTIDGFIALWLSFPSRRAWRKSFALRWTKGAPVLTFDLHRSGGVWVWGLLLVSAVTAVSMNLGGQVTRPLVALFSTLTPTAFDPRTPRPPDQPIAPTIARERILAIAQAEALRRGWADPAGALLYAPEYGLYGVGFFQPGHDHGDGGLGNPWLYFDGQDGSLAGAQVPGSGSAGDIFLQAQFPLHSGRILGLPGRILVSGLGLAVALLSATGVVIWARKRARHAARSIPRSSA